jgi:hypothetical protein
MLNPWRHRCLGSAESSTTSSRSWNCSNARFVAPEPAILGALVQVVASLQTYPLYFFGMEGSI